MEFSKETLQSLAEENNIVLDEESLERFEIYLSLLLEWNEKINLTAITDPGEIMVKHFLDCILPLSYIDLPKGASFIDVGTGGGFPGIPLLIARPDLKATLIDGTKKRLIVVNEFLDALGLEAEVKHVRAEIAGQDKNYREQYDLATARAVTNLRDLSELCIPFVKPGGTFLAMKGPNAEEEKKEAKSAISTLGGSLKNTIEYNLENMGERTLILIEKTNKTPKQYPRPMAKIKKKPIR